MIDIGQLVRSANPASGDSHALTEDELDALLHLIDTRSESMDVKEIVKEDLAPVKPPRPKRAGWLVAAAAFVAVLVIGAAVLLALPGGGETPPAGPTETTVPTPTTTAPQTTAAPVVADPEAAEDQVAPSTAIADPSADQLAMAQQIVDARNSGDFDAWASLLTPDASLAGPFNNRDLSTMGSAIDVELDKVSNAMAFETVLNGQWTLTDCRVADWSEVTVEFASQSGQPLSCGLAYTDDFVEAGGEGEWDFEMIVVGGQGAVTVHEIHYRSVEKAQDAWADFLIWLETQSLDDALIAGRVESGLRDMPWRGWAPKWTEDSATMVASYLDAYLAATG